MPTHTLTLIVTALIVFVVVAFAVFFIRRNRLQMQDSPPQGFGGGFALCVTAFTALAIVLLLPPATGNMLSSSSPRTKLWTPCMP